VRTFSKEDYLTTFTLDELESTLHPAKFCRLNRQLIGHIKACKSYESLDYGKLLMHMEPAPDIATTVSQLKAPLVRKWMQDGRVRNNQVLHHRLPNCKPTKKAAW